MKSESVYLPSVGVGVRWQLGGVLKCHPSILSVSWQCVQEVLAVFSVAPVGGETRRSRYYCF